MVIASELLFVCMSDTERDPALGHAEDFGEESAGEWTDSDTAPIGAVSDEVIGVPLMADESQVWNCHPSWWIFLPQMILTGVLYGFVGVMIGWIYTPLIGYEIPTHVTVAFNETYAALAGFVTQMGIPMNGEFAIPWWFWAVVFMLATLPMVRSYLARRFTHYVITTHRIMEATTFPGKNKNWVEIGNIKSFTSSAGFIEQRLNVGTVTFQPANDDPVIFRHIDDYEYWESNVKELRRKAREEGKEIREEELEDESV